MKNPTLTLIAHSENPPVHKLLEIAARLGWTPQIVRTPFGEKLPEIEETQAVVILGAAATLTRRAELDWLREEITWVEKALEHKLPTYGICFGCQMLALIYGGQVINGPYGREFGFSPVTQVEEDFLFTNDLDGLDVFQAHSNTYVLPSTAKRLMTGELYQEQAARFAHKVYGTQFHPEILPEIVFRWHQFGLERGRTFADYVPATPEAHEVLAERKLKPVHAWLEYFMKALLDEKM